MINMILYVEPVGKKRPRISTRGSFVRQYKDSETVQKEQDLAYAMTRAYQGQPLTGALRLELKAFITRPKSNKSKYHITKPDADNLIKHLCDVGNGILWSDDKQIVEIIFSKHYAPKGYWELKLEQLV